MGIIGNMVGTGMNLVGTGVQMVGNTVSSVGGAISGAGAAIGGGGGANNLGELQGMYDQFSTTLLQMRQITTEGQQKMETARARPQ